MINVNAHINLDFAIPFSSRWSKCLPSGFWWDLFERIEEKRWRGYQTLLKFFVGREGHKPNVTRRQDDFARILQSKLPIVVSLMRRVSTQSNQ